MPLVVVCGLPSSGKTERVRQLVEFLKLNCDREVGKSCHIVSIILIPLRTSKSCIYDVPYTQVEVISDDFSAVSKNNVYASSQEEKTLRGVLKSNAERTLSPDRVVILDSLNYIKGFRYELFCLSKHTKSTHCVLLCETPVEQAREWNSGRGDEKYSQDIFDALVMRFESPDSHNRWDSPLFVLHPDDPLPGADILAALLSRKAPPPNRSTQSQPLSSASFLHELDRHTQEIIGRVLEAQGSGVAGNNITVPGTSEKLRLSRDISMAELRRMRRQFISYTKMHPVEDSRAIPALFVRYLNTSL